MVGVLVEGDGVEVAAERRTVALVRKHGLRSRNDCRGTRIGDSHRSHTSGFLNGGGEATREEKHKESNPAEQRRRGIKVTMHAVMNLDQ